MPVGTYQTIFVLVNLITTRGAAAYDLVHQRARPTGGTTNDVADLGNRAFAIRTPRTASIHVDKEDALLLFMVEVAASATSPTGPARLLATEATARI